MRWPHRRRDPLRASPDADQAQQAFSLEPLGDAWQLAKDQWANWGLLLVFVLVLTYQVWATQQQGRLERLAASRESREEVRDRELLEAVAFQARRNEEAIERAMVEARGHFRRLEEVLRGQR